jgi:hypothetical protein
VLQLTEQKTFPDSDLFIRDGIFNICLLQWPQFVNTFLFCSGKFLFTFEAQLIEQKTFPDFDCFILDFHIRNSQSHWPHFIKTFSLLEL